MSGLPGNLPPDPNEEAAEWCLALAEGALEPVERQQFEAWVGEPANAIAFELATRVWQTAGQASELPELIHIRSNALETFRAANSARWTKPVALRWRWIGGLVAACLLVFVTATYFSTRPEIYRTGIGERRIAMLEDGSRLSLDGDSEVDVSLHNHQRELTLVKGRARFDVAKDPLRPFSVSAGDKVVVATGTAFSVELIRQQVHVILFEGHVAVLDQSQASKSLKDVRLHKSSVPADQEFTPGHEMTASASVGGAGAVITQADNNRALSWEEGQLNFEDEPLALAVERMNRYSRVQMTIGNGSVADVRVSGVYTAGDTAAFLEGVSAIYGIKVVTTPSGIMLTKS